MRKYKSYKSTRISWLDELPAHWDESILKRQIVERKAGAWGEDINQKDINAFCLRIADYDYDRLRFKEGIDYTIRSYDKSEMECRLLKPGDILIEKSGGGDKAPVGRAVLYDLDLPNALYANFMERLRVRSSINARYMVYYLNALYSRRVIWPYVKFTTGIQNLDMLAFGSSEFVPLPPLKEQNKIVAFLDKKLSLIESWKSQKEKQIQALNELKQAEIASAVTKGLNTKVKMKDSGIPWLGNIPNHWDMKYLFQIAHEHYISNKDIHNQNLLSLSYGKIIRKDINTTDGLLPASFNTYQVIEPDNVVFRFTDLQNDHKSLRVGLSKETGIITSAYVVVEVEKNSILPEFFYYILHSYDIKKLFYGMGGGLRQNLNYNGIRKLNIPVPSIEEQKEIVKSIQTNIKNIEETILALEAEIEHLAEFKQRLISDAVTGQINVQNEVE